MYNPKREYQELNEKDKVKVQTGMDIWYRIGGTILGLLVLYMGISALDIYSRPENHNVIWQPIMMIPTLIWAFYITFVKKTK
jgi:predicted Abi (CAAX) family protease